MSSAGEIAVSVYGPQDVFRLRVGTISGRLVAEVEVPAGASRSSRVPGGQGLVFAHGVAGVTRYTVEGDEVQEAAIPALQGDYAD